MCVHAVECQPQPPKLSEFNCERWTTGISPSPVCNVRFLVALALQTQLITSHGAAHTDLFLIKTAGGGRCVLYTIYIFALAHGKHRAASDSILLIEFGCESKMPPSGNTGRNRRCSEIYAHVAQGSFDSAKRLHYSLIQF